MPIANITGPLANITQPLANITETLQTLEYPMVNYLIETTNKIPGNRVFLRSLTDHMITFDRLRFYYFHKQNLTYYSASFLSNINTLGLNQWSLCQDLVQSCTSNMCTTYNNAYNNILESLNHKDNYTDAFIFKRNPSGLGFFANNLDFFFY